jgi:hypothetical protein
MRIGGFFMSPRKTALMLTLIFLAVLLMALVFFNVGQTEFGNDGYVSSVHITDAEPALWSQLGLQLHYAPENEKTAKQFLENVALNLQARGINKVVILPEHIDLKASAEELEGVFIFHFSLEKGGWQLSRQGKVEVSAEYIPLKQSVLATMNAGTTTTATGRGWFSQAHFTQEILDSAADYWVQEVLRSFDLPDRQLSDTNEIHYMTSSLEQIPAAIADLMPENAEPVAFFMQQDSYLLSYRTEDDDLENFLNRELTSRQNMQTVLPWVNVVGGRRMTELHAEDGLQVLKISYADTANIPYTGGFEPAPGNQDPRGEFLVTIIYTRK